MLQRMLLRSSRAVRPPRQLLLNPSATVRLPLATRPQSRIQQLALSSRWYSEAATESKKTEAAPAPATGDKPAAESKTDAAADSEAAKKQLEAKDKEIVELKDRYLRSVADFRNLQERTKREVQSARDFALQRFAKDLLDSVDNLDRALSTVTPEQLEPASATAAKDLAALHGGLRMTETVLMDTLRRHGLERVDPAAEGQMFDANLHEAMFMAPQEGKKDGVVFHTQQKGFTLNGRTIRAAKVGVVKNS